MKNRTPTELAANGALRYGVYDKDGSLLRYEYLKLEDNPTDPGTPIAKATLLKDTTAAMFGLDEYAVPEDVFAFLGQYNQHWWEVTHGIARNVYSEERTAVTKRTNLSYTTDFPFTFSYSKSIAIDPHDGTVSLVDPQTVVLHTDSKKDITTVCAALASQAPIYFKSDYGNVADRVFYAPEGATAPAAGSTELGAGSYTFYMMEHSKYSDYYVCIGNSNATVPAYEVTTTAKWVTAGEITYVHGATRDAYTDGVTEDFDSYVYLGVPFQNMPTAARIATGSYTGTGTFGSSNPNSLTFDFEPKLVLVQEIASYQYFLLPMVSGTTSTGAFGNSASSDYRVNITWSGKKVSWFNSENADYQYNYSGTTYHYIAIG